MYCFEQKCKNIEHPSIVNSYEVTFLEKKNFFQTKTRENEEKLPRETSPISQLTSTAQMEWGRGRIEEESAW